MEEQSQNNSATSKFLKTDDGKTKFNAIGRAVISLPKGSVDNPKCQALFSLQEVQKNTNDPLNYVEVVLGGDNSFAYNVGAIQSIAIINT
jgi:hypothetical protein